MPGPVLRAVSLKSILRTASVHRRRNARNTNGCAHPQPAQARMLAQYVQRSMLDLLTTQTASGTARLLPTKLRWRSKRAASCSIPRAAQRSCQGRRQGRRTRRSQNCRRQPVETMHAAPAAQKGGKPATSSLSPTPPKGTQPSQNRSRPGSRARPGCKMRKPLEGARAPPSSGACARAHQGIQRGGLPPAAPPLQQRPCPCPSAAHCKAAKCDASAGPEGALVRRHRPASRSTATRRARRACGRWWRTARACAPGSPPAGTPCGNRHAAPWGQRPRGTSARRPSTVWPWPKGGSRTCTSTRTCKHQPPMRRYESVITAAATVKPSAHTSYNSCPGLCAP